MNSQSNRRSEYDAIVVGAGSGGLTVAVGLSTFGKSVAMIEADQIGGDCTNVGCIPSKLLLHHSTLGGEDDPEAFGVETLATVRRRRDQLRDHEDEEYGSMENIDLLYGRARLLGDDRVEITASDGEQYRLSAKNIILSTGSSPRRLPIEGLPSEQYLTNDELFEVEQPPGRMVIVGAGPIGMEMAVAFRRLGTEITVLDAAPQILPAMLPEAAAVVERSLVALGVDLKPGMVAHSFDAATNTLAVGPLGADPTEWIADVDHVLMAVGRVPNSDDLGLEAVGVELDRGRIVIDSKGRTSADGIWAVGDVSTEGATTHAANAWGRRVIKHIVAPIAPAGDAPEHPAVVYTSPEAATIGYQPLQVPADVRRITTDFSKADRAYTDGVEDGVIIVDVRRLTGKVLGATIVGPRAGELISIFSLGMKAGLPFHKWYGTVWPYPSYADAIGAVVDEYMKGAMTNISRDAFAWLRGKLRRLRD